jgi:uncharacterized protein (DUF2252 family)
MLASAFSFFRGAAAIMASDLADTPRVGLAAQICGDAHLSNFGVFEAPDRRLIFDVNDFDETHPGPFEWDVKRLAASVAIAGRDRGFNDDDRRGPVLSAVRQYREAMREFAAMRDVDVWYARVDITTIERYRSKVSAKRRKSFDKDVAKAQRKDSLRALGRLTTRENGRLRFVNDPPLIVPVEDLVEEGESRDVEAELEALLSSYRQTLADDRAHLVAGYRYVHAARKVVGVGSVGTRAWVVLLLGRDSDDPLVLQAKEAEASVLEPFLEPSRYEQHGRRIVEGQRLMQAASDIFLGWLRAEGLDAQRRDFYVRQLWDGKGSAEVETMAPSELTIYGQLCGWTLARAHARSGDRIAIASYLGGGKAFDNAIADFAEAYADQNERDYRAMVKAVKAGRVAAETGV